VWLNGWNALTDVIGLNDSTGGKWNGQVERDDGKKSDKN
jgi:hypothetical protein